MLSDASMDKNMQGTTQMLNVTDILKGSDYALTIFTEHEVKAIKLFDRGGKPLPHLRRKRQGPARQARGDRQATLSAQADERLSVSKRPHRRRKTGLFWLRGS
jgi:hypothetical protein